MPAPSSFDYAVIRVVPRVEREEFLNAGVIVFSLERRFLGARVHVDQKRLHALSPDTDFALVQQHLEAFIRVCEGHKDAGPIAQLSQRERFHWLVAPRSTVIQVSPVHSGLCESPEEAVERLFQQLVAR
ncbi:MAG: DUF3037 domain-containing protein [Longimicrobiales bacterium]